MIAFKDPYDKLWRTAYDFHVKYETWYNGESAVVSLNYETWHVHER